jgi:hypothetical protein
MHQHRQRYSAPGNIGHHRLKWHHAARDRIRSRQAGLAAASRDLRQHPPSPRRAQHSHHADPLAPLAAPVVASPSLRRSLTPSPRRDLRPAARDDPSRRSLSGSPSARRPHPGRLPRAARSPDLSAATNLAVTGRRLPRTQNGDWKAEWTRIPPSSPPRHCVNRHSPRAWAGRVGGTRRIPPTLLFRPGVRDPRRDDGTRPRGHVGAVPNHVRGAAARRPVVQPRRDQAVVLRRMKGGKRGGMGCMRRARLRQRPLTPFFPRRQRRSSAQVVRAAGRLASRRHR